MKWIKKWTVQGSKCPWTVAVTEDGQYGCSCPRWKFQRAPRTDCHHIQLVKDNPDLDANVPTVKPEYVLVMADRPTREGDKLLIPLVTPGDTDMEATICAFMLENGWSMGEVRERRNHMPRSWTAKAIRAHVERYGPAVRPVAMPRFGT